MELRDGRVGQVERVHDNLWWSKSHPLADADIGEMVGLQDLDEHHVVATDVFDVVRHGFRNVSAVTGMVIEGAGISFRSLGVWR